MEELELTQEEIRAVKNMLGDLHAGDTKFLDYYQTSIEEKRRQFKLEKMNKPPKKKWWQFLPSGLPSRD